MPAFVAFGLIVAPPAIAASMDCSQAAIVAEAEQGLPHGLLRAIGLVETGHHDPATGADMSWPWAIDVNGQDHFFNTAAEAVARVQDLVAQGLRSIDVGCFQINLAYHPAAFSSVQEAFDPLANARAAARFLIALRHETGDWNTAVMRYHSADTSRSIPYHGRVMRALAGQDAPRPQSGPQRIAGVHIWTPVEPGTAPSIIHMAGSSPVPSIIFLNK